MSTLLCALMQTQGWRCFSALLLTSPSKAHSVIANTKRKASVGVIFSKSFLPARLFLAFVRARDQQQHAGYPNGPHSHTHNPWVTGGTKELSRCWEPRRGQSRLRCRCLISFSPRMTFIFFPLLIPPFNPLLLSLPGSGHFRVFSSVCPHYPSPSSSILVSI